jgi:predicted DNA-binding transcriptional regulator AlpA
MNAEQITATAARVHAAQNPDPQPERLFTLAEIQAAGGFSRSTLYRLRHGGGLRCVTIGGVTRVRESDWRAFLEKHATATTEGGDNV